MQRRIGPVTVETIAAESPKFTAPLLLIHGLWCTAAVWRRYMGYLAHRGWSCHALNLRGRAEASVGAVIGRVRFEDHLRDIHQVIAASAEPPVLMGHDLGGLLALCCAGPPARAAVALAPLVPRAIGGAWNRALSGWRPALAVWCSRPLPVPRGRTGTTYFGSGAPGGTIPDSALVARELASDSFRLSGNSATPTLVLAGERDVVSPPGAVQRLADHFGATFRSIEGAGHAMAWEPGWEDRVSEIHRWLVQTLGDPLLAFRADDGE